MTHSQNNSNYIIRQIDANTNTIIKDFHCSLREVSRQVDVPASHISDVINGSRKTTNGFIFKKIEVDNTVTTQIDNTVTNDNTVTTQIDNTVNNKIPVRKIPLTLNDIDKDDSNEIYRTLDTVTTITEREREYVDWVYDTMINLPSDKKIKNKTTNQFYYLYKDRSVLETEIASHLKNGYKYDCEPATTIKRACELVLFDLFLDDEVREFQSQFN